MTRVGNRIVVGFLATAVVFGGLWLAGGGLLRCVGRALVRVDNDVPAVDAVLIPTADWIANDVSTESLMAALE